MPRQNGLTLIELLIALAISAIVLGLVSTLVVTGFRSYEVNRKQVEAQESARIALSRVTKLIREAQPSNNGSYPIAAAGAQSLTFYVNMDTDTDREQARIYLDGTTLKLGLIEPVGEPATYPSANERVSTIVTGVQNGASPVFLYYDENYTGSQAPLTLPVTIQNVRLVHLILSIDPDPARPPNAVDLETSVSFRNLKNNL